MSEGPKHCLLVNHFQPVCIWPSLNNMASSPTCWGCQEGQPNQLAHMDFGGCMYSEFIFSTEELKEIGAEAERLGKLEKLSCISTVKSGRKRKPPKRFIEE